MKVVQEITVWDQKYQPNHTYLVDGNRMLAYIPSGTERAIYFSQPLNFDTRKRKFQEVSKNLFRFMEKSQTVKITGSRGDTYEVDPDQKTCSCTGFKYRGKCRHLEQVLKQP